MSPVFRDQKFEKKNPDRPPRKAFFQGQSVSFGGSTPTKTNMSPETQWLEDVFPIEMVPFWGTC